ncbi:MAG: ABC transporter ATP-binding protein [Tissierellia bacterium]|nr:ABC transporter ATP-binding protein [Tissierellia bacterium]
MDSIVEYKDLHTYFYTDRGIVKSVNGISFTIPKGKTTAVVGESGCGKSVTALSLMGLIQKPQGKVVQGEIIFDGKNVLELSDHERRELRGSEMAMIFQEPMTSLNPSLKIGYQLREVLKLHGDYSKEEQKKLSLEMLEKVELPNPEKYYNSYPHELSGGQRQRIMIAMALMNRPKLLIADEPTTALDVTIQAQVLELMSDLKDDFQTSIMLITHDLGVVAEMADEVVVMYAGKIVERGTVFDIFDHPSHPYTQGLLKAKPSLDSGAGRLYNIPGTVPNPIGLGETCYFYDRCPHGSEKCLEGFPPEISLEGIHKVSCILYEKGVS